MAKKPETAESALVQAVILCDCALGRIGSVVSLTDSEAKAGEAMGVIDSNKDAVAYAKSTQKTAN